MEGYFEQLPLKFNVEPLLSQIENYPKLWNVHKARTLNPFSPHREVDDIWIRYKKDGVPSSVLEPFDSVWYPEADCLSKVYTIIDELFSFANATHLGGILITKIKPGKVVYPHHDRGAWHAEFHNYKVYVALKSNTNCINWFGEIDNDPNLDVFVMKPGEAWRFNNQVTHTCFNNGNCDRISLIISMRVGE